MKQHLYWTSDELKLSLKFVNWHLFVAKLCRLNKQAGDGAGCWISVKVDGLRLIVSLQSLFIEELLDSLV